jgi:hypothetical protein
MPAASADHASRSVNGLLGVAPRHRGILDIVIDDDSGARAPERRSGAKRTVLRLARPLIGYFDRRFQEVHDHLDRQPQLQQLSTDINAQLEQVSALSRQTREEVAANADTVTELAFTLERFADLFTARVDEIVETMFAANLGGAPLDSHLVELPFAYAAAETLPTGVGVATFTDGGGPLPLALASLGLRVSALAAGGLPTRHPNLAVMEEAVERWSPTRPLHAIFALSAVAGLGLDRHEQANDLDRQVVDLFRKWLQPDGLLVLTLPFGEWSVGRHARTYDERHLTELLADWDIRDRREVERIDDHLWRLVEPGAARSRAGMVLIRATPRL